VKRTQAELSAWPEADMSGSSTDRASIAPGRLGFVSDSYIRLIPTSPDWQPTHEAGAVAVAYVASLFSGPDQAVEEVESNFYDRVTLIDAGENTSQITCPRCSRDIGLEIDCQGRRGSRRLPPRPDFRVRGAAVGEARNCRRAVECA
jgi:hypothetical protein